MNFANMSLDRPWASIDYQAPASTQVFFTAFMQLLTNYADLEYQMTMAQLGGDTAGQRRLAPLLATAEGRYDFAVPAYLNSVYPDVQVTRFQDWFLRNWASIP